MVQSGANVRLDLSGSEFLVFANKTIDQFSAGQFKLGLDKSALHLTFADEFNTLSLWNGTERHLGFELLVGRGERQHAHQQQANCNGTSTPTTRPTKSVNPFGIEDGVLTITAARAPTRESARTSITTNTRRAC